MTTKWQNGQSWLDRAGNHASNQLTVTERFTLLGPNHIRYEATLDDPQTYTRPWTIEMPLYRLMDQQAQLLEHKCVPFADGLLYQDLLQKDTGVGRCIEDGRARRVETTCDGGAAGGARAAGVSASFLLRRVRLEEAGHAGGEVVMMEWANPHSWLHIDVKKADGTVERWKIEGGSPSVLLRLGWNRNSLPAGTKVTVVGFQSKDGALRASSRDLRFPDGKRMDLGGSGSAPQDKKRPRRPRPGLMPGVELPAQLYAACRARSLRPDSSRRLLLRRSNRDVSM